VHLEAASTRPVAALAALQVLQVAGGMLLTVVDDMVVDLGRFSCISRLAAWQQSTEPDVQQLQAASRRVRTLSSSSAVAS